MLQSLICSVGLLALQATDGPRLDYTLEIINVSGNTSVVVTLDMAGDDDGRTEIILPGDWGGETELWRALDDFRVTSSDPGAVIERGDDPSRLDLVHAPGAPLSLRYTLTPERVGEPQARLHDYYRPYIEADWVHLIGHTIFAFPDSETDYGVDVTTSTPVGWALASDLNQGPLDINSLLTSITVAGDFRIVQRPVNGAAVRVAIRGEHGFDDAAMMDAVAQVVTANEAYWNAEPTPFLVTVLALEAGPGVMSVGGTNLGDAFAFFATGNADADTLMRILMHEHVHTWIPGQVGGPIIGHDEAAGYWFSEGFTDFLTQRTAVRAGLWPAQTALEAWNTALLENSSSPARDAPNDAISSGFWTDGDLQRLPYHRGMIFAALIDHTIHAETGGRLDLDDVLAAMHTNPPVEPAPLAFADAVLDVTGVDIAPLFERHIINGEPVSLPASAFGACGTVETITEPIFVYGMTGQRNADDRFEIDTVDPDGPAAPAGFRPGMVILERLEGAVGNAAVDSVLRVQTPDGEILDLRYRPTNGHQQTYPRISVAAGDLESNGCSARISGL